MLRLLGRALILMRPAVTRIWLADFHLNSAVQLTVRPRHLLTSFSEFQQGGCGSGASHHKSPSLIFRAMSAATSNNSSPGTGTNEGSLGSLFGVNVPITSRTLITTVQLSSGICGKVSRS